MSFTPAQKRILEQSPVIQVLKDEFEKEQQGAGKRMRGGSFWANLWSGIKKVGADVNKFLKDTQIISKATQVGTVLAPILGIPQAVPVLQGISTGAKSLGYGRKKPHMGGAKKRGMKPMVVLKGGNVISHRIPIQPAKLKGGMAPNGLQIEPMGRRLGQRGGSAQQTVPYGSISDTRAKIKV